VGRSHRSDSQETPRLKGPRKAFFEATAGVEPFAKRDEIESAANHLQTISDQAHFYAGLAFGVTLADFGRVRPLARLRAVGEV
jgi:hypothetical protein